VENSEGDQKGNPESGMVQHFILSLIYAMQKDDLKKLKSKEQELSMTTASPFPDPWLSSANIGDAMEQTRQRNVIVTTPKVGLKFTFCNILITRRLNLQTVTVS
jgi:hypothetical protein